MSNFIWSILITVICVVIIYALIPPFFRIIGFTASADLLLIIRICIAALAILFVLKNKPTPSV